MGMIHNANHVHQLSQLLHQLLDAHGVIFPHNDSDSGNIVIFRIPGGNTLNIESPPADEAGNPGQNTGTVFN
ncbi:hypothetical protein SDC9_194297 [bioreactor metagenome]|uniref:Uncharacterized protein n=1 Tax=bioreactor metagenome TaxID=1076179 RepID=A0A645I6H4_9ZZZZ